MFVVDATAVVPAPPERVFALVGSLAAASRWCGGVCAARRPGRPRDPRGTAGDSAVLVYTALGQRFHVVTRVVARVAPAAVTYAGTAERCFDLTIRLTLEPADGGTQLGYRTELSVHAPGPLADHRAALCRLFAQRVPRDLDRLASLVARASPGMPSDAAGTAAVSQAARAIRAAGSRAG
jgi:uncharacterized protein YndB with AHSA1/START domain